METATLAGATICLPVPSFYDRPQDIDEIIDTGVGRVLDQFGIQTSLVRRWTEQ
jgi:4-hydroxy-3-polyprenylbenzoate decarboxylase